MKVKDANSLGIDAQIHYLWSGTARIQTEGGVVAAHSWVSASLWYSTKEHNKKNALLSRATHLNTMSNNLKIKVRKPQSFFIFNFSATMSAIS